MHSTPARPKGSKQRSGEAAAGYSSAGGSAYVWYCDPETRGRTLEKIQELLER